MNISGNFSQAAAVAAALLSGTASPVLAKEKEPLVLAPDAAWQVKFEDRRCTVSQQFGQGDDATLMALIGTDPLGPVNIMLIGEPFKTPYYNDVRTIHYTLSPGAVAGSFQGSPVSSAGHKGFMSAYPIRFDGQSIEEHKASLRKVSDLQMADEGEPEDTDAEKFQEPWAEKLKSVRSINFTGEFKADNVVLQTESLNDMMLAVEQCQDAQFAKWGLDPVVQRSLASRVKNRSPEQFVSAVQRDYPAAALRKSEQALVSILFLVDEMGKITGCEVERVTQADNFGDKICDLARENIEFEPAKDQSGNAVASYSMTSIRYSLYPSQALGPGSPIRGRFWP